MRAKLTKAEQACWCTFFHTWGKWKIIEEVSSTEMVQERVCDSCGLSERTTIEEPIYKLEK